MHGWCACTQQLSAQKRNPTTSRTIRIPQSEHTVTSQREAKCAAHTQTMDKSSNKLSCPLSQYQITSNLQSVAPFTPKTPSSPHPYGQNKSPAAPQHTGHTYTHTLAPTMSALFANRTTSPNASLQPSPNSIPPTIRTVGANPHPQT